VDEHPDLPSGLDRERGERAGQLGRGDVVTRDAALVEALERAQRGGPEPGRVAEDFDG
jgi:hypothetical protein